MHVTSEVQEHAPAHWDDEIDLRQLVEVLLRRKWLIFGLIVAAVALAGIYSFFVLPPRYEATMTVALPAVDGEDGLGMSVNAYRAFAFSNRVLGAMIEDGGLNMTPPGVEAGFHIRGRTSPLPGDVSRTRRRSSSARSLPFRPPRLDHGHPALVC